MASGRIEGRQQLTIMIIEHFIFDSESACRFHCFCPPPFGKNTPAHGLVAGISIGYRYKLHFVPHRGKLGSKTAGSDIAVVWMGAKGNHADLGGQSNAHEEC